MKRSFLSLFLTKASALVRSQAVEVQNLSPLPSNRAHPRGALRTLAECCSATWRIFALVALLGLAAAPSAQAAAGPLVSWGNTDFGQVSGTPAGTFSAVAPGGFHSVAIKPDGTLVSWGWDGYGQVSGTPAGTFSAVAAGTFHSVAIKPDGTLVSWGRNDWGQVSGTPAGTFSAVAAGDFHSVAIKPDGTLVSWGKDAEGEVSGTPAGAFSAVAAGGNHSVAIKPDGTLVSWGWDFYGQVSGTPAGTFSAVAAGATYSVAIKSDGTLVSWGDNSFGQVSGTPAGTFSAVAAGHLHSVAIKPDGSLVSWGRDLEGQVSGTPAGPFSAVAAGAFHNVAIKDVAPPVAPVLADVTGECSATVTAPTTTDHDGGTVTGTTSDPLVYNSQGTFTIHWTFTDGNGNSSTANQTVIINDTIAPVITDCPANIIVQTGPGRTTCNQVATWMPPLASDNCTLASFTSTHSPGATFPAGTTTVTCIAIDGAGNQTRCSFTVTVVDTTPPSMAAPAPSSAPSDRNCQAAIPNVLAQTSASDGCGAVTLAQSPAAGTLVGVGTHTITITATDTSNNSRTATTTFTVNAVPSFTVSVNPGSVKRGDKVTLTAAYRNCASSPQTATLKVSLTRPGSTTLMATLPLTLPAGRQGSVSLPIPISKSTPTGAYSLTLDVYVGGVKMGTSTASLTVTP